MLYSIEKLKQKLYIYHSYKYIWYHNELLNNSLGFPQIKNLTICIIYNWNQIVCSSRNDLYVVNLATLWQTSRRTRRCGLIWLKTSIECHATHGTVASVWLTTCVCVCVFISPSLSLSRFVWRSRPLHMASAVMLHVCVAQCVCVSTRNTRRGRKYTTLQNICTSLRDLSLLNQFYEECVTPCYLYLPGV